MKPDLFNIIPYAFDEILKNHPELMDEFRAFEGSIILIDLINTNTRIYLLISETGMKISNQPVKKPDLSIRATPLELFQYLFRARNNTISASGEIELSGNIGLAQKIQNLFVKFEVDWEDKVSQVMGDELSHSLFFAMNKIIKNIKYGKRELEINFAEVLKYEKEIVIDQQELMTFNKSVDQLRDDVEKLNFRVNRLSSLLGTY